MPPLGTVPMGLKPKSFLCSSPEGIYATPGIETTGLPSLGMS
jgi:hypothetical protein